MSMKRASPISGLLKFLGFYRIIESRHLPEWRLPLFTVIVIVYLPICTVKVIGIMLTPLQRSAADRLIRIMVMLFPAPYRAGLILSANRPFVNFRFVSVPMLRGIPRGQVPVYRLKLHISGRKTATAGCIKRESKLWSKAVKKCYIISGLLYR